MKKILTLLISIILISTCFIGCADKTTPLSNVEGAVKSGNGSFAVEKGDYLYFISGKQAINADNKFGEVQKGSLQRVKTSDLSNLAGANIETVIPKLFVSSSYATGFYIYGDCVYFATPSDEKNHKGEIKTSELEFFRFNLKTGKTDNKEIATAKTGSTEFRFIENNGKVYLAFTSSETVDSATVNKLVVYDTETKKEVFTSDGYSQLLMPEDNSKYFYYTQKGVLKDLDNKSASFDELYRYEIGEESADIFLSGAGSNYLESAGRKDLDASQLIKESGFSGVTINLIKNTGKIVVYKVTSVDDNSIISYYGFNTFDSIEDLKKTENNPLVKFNGSNSLLSTKLVASSYYKALNEIYYVDSQDVTKGLCKFNHERANDGDLKNGVEFITKDASELSIAFADTVVVNDAQKTILYLSSSAEGIYYQCDLSTGAVEKINSIAFNTSTEWYSPRVINGKYFIGSLTSETYLNYVYVKDMTNIGKDEYETNLEKIVEENRENALSIMATGLLDETAKESVQAKIDENFPEDEE